MAQRQLSSEEQDVLRDIVSKYFPSDAEYLSDKPPDLWLSGLRTGVRDAVGRELVASGFDRNYEPTRRGRLLEGLIDYLNRLEFGPKSS